MKEHKKHFFGTTTIGEKGQVVIPAEARESLSLKKGDKLLVFGKGKDFIALAKLDSLEKFVAHLEERLGTVRKLIKKTGKK